MQAKLAFYEDGVEVMALTFNAVGSDKENWFSKSRLLTSPWTDLHPTASTNFFSMVGSEGSYVNARSKQSRSKHTEDFECLHLSSSETSYKAFQRTAPAHPILSQKCFVDGEGCKLQCLHCWQLPTAPSGNFVRVTATG